MTGATVNIINFRPGYRFTFIKIVVDLIRSLYMRQHLSLCHLFQLRRPEFIFIPFVHDPPDFPFSRVSYINRSVRSHCKTHGPELRLAGTFNSVSSGKTVCKNLPFTGGCAIFKRNKTNKITRLRIGSPVCRTMKRYERSIFITSGELISLVKKQIIRRPMPRESHNRVPEFAAPSNYFSITSILGCQNFFLLFLVIVAIRPAKIITFFYSLKFFGRKNCVLPGRKFFRP